MHESRRTFLQRLGAGAILGVASAASIHARGVQQQRASRHQPDACTPPPVLKDPNILIMIVDQMRLPAWLSASQMAMLNQTILPNIMGRLQSDSYNFGPFFVAAANCAPSPACLLSGLYAPQTALYITPNPANNAPPALNPAFPIWGGALPLLNPAYKGNVWWFGKWHLSNELSATPLAIRLQNLEAWCGGPASG